MQAKTGLDNINKKRRVNVALRISYKLFVGSNAFKAAIAMQAVIYKIANLASPVIHSVAVT